MIPLATKNASGSDVAKSVVHAAKLLKLVGQHPEGVSLKTLHRESGIPVSTAHRLVSSLVAESLLEQVPGSRLYRPGAALHSMVALAVGRLQMVSRRWLTWLNEETQEGVGIAVARNGHRVVILAVESPLELRAEISLGLPGPLHAGASGKVLLAHLKEPGRERILRQLEGDPGKDLDVPALRLDLARIREQGYAIAWGERVRGIVGVSAPIFDPHGEAVAALTLAAPDVRLHFGTVADVVRLVLRAAQGITADLA